MSANTSISELRSAPSAAGSGIANAKVNLYDRLFKEAHPGENNNYLDDLNLNSLTSKEIKIEENLKTISPGDQYQFERHGYFIADDLSKPEDIILNRTTTLRDNWQ